MGRSGRTQYSNAGINTAGRLIEVLSGMPCEQFMQQRRFDPLRMKAATFWPTTAQVRKLARAYQPNPTGTGLQEVPITWLPTHMRMDRRRGLVLVWMVQYNALPGSSGGTPGLDAFKAATLAVDGQ